MDFAAARRHMVLGQIATNKVTDPGVLDALQTVPREWFVPPIAQSLAYGDEDVALGVDDQGYQRWLMEPMVIARLLQAAAVTPDCHVLDIAPATGYSTGLFSLLAGRVVAVEGDAKLRDQASALVKKLGGCKCKFLDSLPQADYADYDGYDVIFLNGAVASPPLALADRLRPGGRLLLIHRPHSTQPATAYLYRHLHGQPSRLALFDCATPWMPGFAPPHRFVF
ncbi:MAG: protein-L-isoaspartate O-methyltransferase [Alphaproteobacteria bacterium]|nr:protein-L-isoaspartate O-methyltransferase [Alphaproteobacteria bacterium]